MKYGLIRSFCKPWGTDVYGVGTRKEWYAPLVEFTRVPDPAWNVWAVEVRVQGDVKERIEKKLKDKFIKCEFVYPYIPEDTLLVYATDEEVISFLQDVKRMLNKLSY